MFSKPSIQLADALVGWGRVLADQHREAAAESLLRAGLEIRLQKLPRSHQKVAESEVALGVCLARVGRSSEAQPLLAHGLPAMLAHRNGRRDPIVAEARRLAMSLRAGS